MSQRARTIVEEMADMQSYEAPKADTKTDTKELKKDIIGLGRICLYSQ
jgi:hypothetical protein